MTRNEHGEYVPTRPFLHRGRADPSTTRTAGTGSEHAHAPLADSSHPAGHEGALPAYRRVEQIDPEAFKLLTEGPPNREGSFTDSDEVERNVLSLIEGQVVRLEHDCYAISIIDKMPTWLSLGLPLASALGQFLVLYFIAFANENMFDEGHWLEPISPHVSLNAMKGIALLVSLFKVSTELQHAQCLFRALMICDFQGSRRRVSGWWALILQYAVANSVLFAAISSVLAAQSCSIVMSKIFSVFVIVDMDNLMARFIEVIWTISFHVKADKDLLEDWKRRENVFGGFSVRLCFMVLPLTFMVCEVGVSISCKAPPLTILRHGYVSNRDAPQMVIDLEGCCPPKLIDMFDPDLSNGIGDVAYKFNVLALSPPESPPPRIFWVVLPASVVRPPSSLQVLEGRDGDGNIAVRTGQADMKPVQVHYWLQQNGYKRDTYAVLQRSKRLYHRWAPYNATMGVSSIDTRRYGPAFRLYAVAQNPRTLALATLPAASSTLFTSMCAPRCASCELAGTGRCDRCQKGSHRTADGQCLPCPQHCNLCELTTYHDTTFFGSERTTMPCDVGGCEQGYGLMKSGDCSRCEVKNCLSCDFDPSVCRQCQQGYGLSTNHTCEACGGDHCICMFAGGCDFCETGWGFTENGTCSECPDGCAMCRFAQDGICESCKPGYATDDGGRCWRCPRHCVNCTVNGVGKCDNCQVNFGYNSLTSECVQCEDPHCLRCKGENPRQCVQCTDSMGITPEGTCETCGTSCRLCNSVGTCRVCEEGYALDAGSSDCMPCSDFCQNCTKTGPALCDVCYPGFSLDKATHTCTADRVEV